MAGQIVDATLVPVPNQPNTKEEKETIKGGVGGRAAFPSPGRKPPPRIRQKDRDARWTVEFSKAK
jgi:hypothetical protein